MELIINVISLTISFSIILAIFINFYSIKKELEEIKSELYFIKNRTIEIRNNTDDNKKHL